MTRTPAALDHAFRAALILDAALGPQLTAAYVVGSDGIVYPDFTGVGVTDDDDAISTAVAAVKPPTPSPGRTAPSARPNIAPPTPASRSATSARSV
ncbi:MAG: hypothetical protein H7067_02450 [Burkholderiales bacterium]|nr:hypothetical protein [Opitutaceae bacterium]